VFVPGTMSVRSSIQLRKMNVAIAPDDIDLASSVEQHRQIVEGLLHLRGVHGPAELGGAEDLRRRVFTC